MALTRQQQKAMFAKKFNKMSSDNKGKILRDASNFHDLQKAGKEDRPIIKTDLESPFILSHKHTDFKDLPKGVKSQLLNFQFPLTSKFRE